MWSRRGLFFLLVLTSCSGMEEQGRNIVWPFSGSYAPTQKSENILRIKGRQIHELPILPQTGDIWPGQPEKIPTLADISSGDAKSPYQGSFQQLNEALEKQLPNRHTLHLGEELEIKNGKMILDKEGLVPDPADHFISVPEKDLVQIPNEDGTVTLVAPDGTMRVVSSGLKKQLSVKALRAPSTNSAPSRKMDSGPVRMERGRSVSGLIEAGEKKKRAVSASRKSQPSRRRFRFPRAKRIARPPNAHGSVT